MKLYIIHTNDIHSHLEYWDSIAEYVNLYRQEILRRGDLLLLCDVGDAMDTVHPLVEATQGQVMVDLFNNLSYDVVTIGNNEGLNFTKNQLETLYEKANFSVTCANLIDQQTGDLPHWAHAFVVKEMAGFRMAFIGLTAPYASYRLNGYQVLDVYDSLETQLKLLESGTEPLDFIILLSHLGLQEDRIMAERFPQLDIILGAHSHHYLPNGEMVGETLLAACGRFGEFVGQIEIDPCAKTIQSSTLSIEQIQELVGMEQQEDYDQKGRDLLSQEMIAELPFSLYSQRTEGAQSFIQHALTAIKQKANTQLAFLSTGLFLADLPAGQISLNHLHEALPHPIHVASLRMRGSSMYEMLEEMRMQEDDLEYKLIAGSGFRGKIFGRFIFSGLFFDGKDWLVDGQPIEADYQYEIACIDHYAFVPFFPKLRDHGNIHLYFPDFIRHVMAEYLQNKFPLEG